MPRLLRPHIPVETRCRVVLRQLGEMFIEDVMSANRYLPRDHRKLSYGRLLAEKLALLAELLKCEVADLHLDHNPALGAREKVFRKGEHVGYKPDANDPEHLIYREAAAHRIKTNVRGEHGQHPDRVLIKKMRRHEKAVPRAASTGTPRKPSYANRKTGFRSAVNKSKLKRKWASRPLRSASRWPKRSKR
jgi:hypothetical protein